MGVVEAPGKAKRLEVRIRILGDVPKFIIVDALGDIAVLGVDNESRGAEVVTDDAIGDTVLDQIIRDIEPCAVDEVGFEVALAIEFGDGVQLVLGRSCASCARDTCTSLYIV